MNKFLLALLATATALAITPSALANTTIPTGAGGVLNTEIASIATTPIDGTLGGPPNFSATFSESVWTYGGGSDLAFEYTVTNTAGAVDSINHMSTNYGSWANGSLLLDAVSGDGVSGIYNGVGTITVTFAGDLGAPGVGSGIDTSTYILYTDATAADWGTITLQDTAVGSDPALVPAPEPSSLLLLGTGLLGLAFVAFRKAKSSGVVLSM
ncbi:MAG: PEP-CTERM sorting domain-containing protein [Terracidiphilus sp.]|jgi:hypothetical protein